MNIGIIGPIKENYKQNESPEIIPKTISDSEDFSSLSSIEEAEEKERISLIGKNILSRNNSEEINEQSHEKITNSQIIVIPKLLDSPRTSNIEELSIQPTQPITSKSIDIEPVVILPKDTSKVTTNPIVNIVKPSIAFAEKKSQTKKRNLFLRFFDRIYLAIILIKDSIKNFILKIFKI